MKSAIKIMDKKKVYQSRLQKDFVNQELEALQDLSHPHIVRVLDLFEDSDNIYIVSELIRGGNLA